MKIADYSLAEEVKTYALERMDKTMYTSKGTENAYGQLPKDETSIFWREVLPTLIKEVYAYGKAGGYDKGKCGGCGKGRV